MCTIETKKHTETYIDCLKSINLSKRGSAKHETKRYVHAKRTRMRWKYEESGSL